MPKFRWSIDGGATWTYEDRALPYDLPVTEEQYPIVQALGAQVQAGDYVPPVSEPGGEVVGLIAPVNLFTAGQSALVETANIDYRSNWTVAGGVLSQIVGNSNANDVRIVFDTPLTAGHAHIATWKTNAGTTGSYKPQFGGAGSAAGVSFAGTEDAPKFQYLPADEATGAFTRFGFNPTTDDLDTEFTEVSVFDLSATDPNDVDALVIACVGDSNMGNAVSDFATEENLEIEFDGRVWYVPCLRVSPNSFDKTGSERHVPQPCIEPVQAASGAARMSPLMALGSELADWAAGNGKPVLLMSLSEAGSGLNGTEDWRKSSSVGVSGGRMYNEMLLMWGAVQALGPGHQLAGAVVSLGANDTTGADYNQVWVPHARQFVDDMRADLGVPDLPICWITVGDHYEPIEGEDRGARMIAAQESLDQDSGSPNSIANVRVVRPPSGYQLSDATDPHFNAAGMQANGRALGQGLLQLLPGAETGPIVVLIAGQSNSVGRAVYDGLGYHASNSWQWVQSAGEIQPVDGLAMLDHPDPSTSGDMGLSIGLSDALRAMYPGRQIIFVPCGYGATDFNSGDWTAGTGPRYQDMVTRANAFTAATGHSISFVAWHQGEFDIDHWRDYRSALTEMMDQAAQDITGLSDSTSWVLGELERTIGGARTINSQLQDLPRQRAHTALVASEGLSRFDTYHFDAPSLRSLGARYATAWDVAATNTNAQGFTDLLQGEWLLGADNTTLEAVAGGSALAPVAAAPALATGYATLSGGSGLESPFAETENVTLLAVVRRIDGQNAMYMGNLPSPGTNGVGGFYFNNTDGFNTRGQPYDRLELDGTQVGQWHLVAMSVGATTDAVDINPRNIALAAVIGADQESSDIKSVENGSSRTPYLGHYLGVGDVAYGFPGGIDAAYLAIYSGQLGLGELAVQYDRIRDQLAARGIDLA